VSIFSRSRAQVLPVVQTLDMIGEPLPSMEAQQLKDAKTFEQITGRYDRSWVGVIALA
jgi:hypothetical protein